MESISEDRNNMLEENFTFGDIDSEDETFLDFDNSVEGTTTNNPLLDLDEQVDDGSSTKLRSKVWKYFKKLPKGDDDKMKAECVFCKHVYIAESNHGTSNMRRHLKRMCPVIKAKGMASNIFSPSPSGSTTVKSNEFNPTRYREALAMSIVRHEYPFLYVEHEGTRNVHSILNSEVKHISRNTAKADILKLFNMEKEKLHQLLQLIPGRICLTSDMWSSITTDGYMCITAHFVDKEWRLKKFFLNFMYMPAPHNGLTIATKFSELMSGWGIEEKLFSVTLDNASANTTFCDSYESQLNLRKSLLLGGRFFRLRCCAHILNLIVQEGLKELDRAVHKIRESVKYFKGSQLRGEKFAECLDKLGVKGPRRLRQDVPTRWNSTYLMLERALLFRLGFIHYAFSDSSYKDCPSANEWFKVEKICKFLKLFYDLTKTFSGSTYPTANLYFQGVWKIELHLNETIESGDDVLKKMAERMKAKFGKYWSDYSTVLSIATVLDPRYKMKMIEFSYKKLYGSAGQYQSSLVREALYELFDEYVTLYSKPSANASVSSSTTLHGIDVECEEEMRGFDAFHSEVNDQDKKSQLDLYLEEICCEWRQPLDILMFWKSVEYRFPELARMARDVLSIPISTVASEAAFSSGGRVLDQYRSSLTPNNVEALICTKDWLFESQVKAKHDIDDDSLEVNLIVTAPQSRFATASSSSSSKRIKC